MNKDDITANWRDLRKELGPSDARGIDQYEAPASKHLAKLLRDMAGHIESGNWPIVYGYYHVKDKGPFTELRVVLSNPWGG